MTFSKALEFLKNGEQLQRVGWNGKGQYVFLYAGVSERNALPYLCLSTVQGQWVPWLASQTDVLADDWEFLQAK